MTSIRKLVVKRRPLRLRLPRLAVCGLAWGQGLLDTFSS